MGRKKRKYSGRIIYGFIPSFAKNILETNLPVPSGISIDGMYYILLYISNYRMINRKLKKKDGVPICASEIKKILSNYQDYLNLLLKIGILIIIKKHSAFNSCARYSFGKAEDKSWQSVAVRNGKICEKEQTRIMERIEKVRLRYPYLTKWFNDDLEYIEPAFNPDVEITFANEKDQINFLSRKRLSKQEFTFTFDNASGRFHSNLTNLKSVYRKFLRYNNQPLAGMDLKNSQAYFFAFAINHFAVRQNNDLLRNVLKYSNRSVLSQVLKNLKDGSIYARLDSDIEQFTELVSSGTFYERFESLLKKNQHVIKNNIVVNREYAKKKIFELWFANEKRMSAENKIYLGVLKCEWPSLYQFMHMLKIGKHNTLALLLQSIERYYLLDLIAREYSELYPESCLYSIHDSLITYEKDIFLLEELMKNRLFEYTGILPKIELDKKWSKI